MKKILKISFGLGLLLIACGNSDPQAPSNPSGGNTPTPDASGINKVTSGALLDITTDKACYTPGENVTFTISSLPANACIRYRHGLEVIKEESAAGNTWTWTPPTTDFRGYMVDVYTLDGDVETIHATIAVDVSSDWTRFPRYGFIATFDRAKSSQGVVESDMEYLKRCHINGVQFQDWHNKHHWPLGGTRDHLDEVYYDIANREVYTSVVKKYIEVQHKLGMKSIFYNLCFGALNDAAEDGVKEEWYVFKNKNASYKDSHNLPASWKSNIFVLNPGNVEWQQYIGDRNDDVYANLDFDGYQIDQLGNRGNLYDINGEPVDLPTGYASFIDAMKERHPDKRLVMNAVGSYGAHEIVGTGKVDFCYNETWGDEAQFNDLYKIIKANDQYSGETLRTVFASYMNYDLAGRTNGYMNNPGVILTDAVIMALGGSHLELGDHMLSREYFPASPLQMNAQLREAMIRYYDFMTAYENLLRDTPISSEFTPSITCNSTSDIVRFNPWPAKQGNVNMFAKNVGGKQVIHLLNMINADNLSWRDLEGTRKAPLVKTNIPVTVKSGKKISKVWVASPDYHGGVPQQLAFTQSGDDVVLTIPAINYWTMLVLE